MPRYVITAVVLRKLFDFTLTNRIVTWNVRTLYAAGKLDKAIKEMKRLKIDILGICETRWPGNGRNGTCQQEDTIMYYAGSTNGVLQHRHGVGILIGDRIKSSVMNVVPHPERIIVMQLAGKSFHINIVQGYAPTADKPEHEVAELNEQLHDVLESLKRQEITIVMGDFNAKMGRGGVIEGVMEQFGVGDRNERGETLIEFYREENLTIINTCYDLHPRRLYTWKSPKDNSKHIIKNQIDYFIIKRHFHNNLIRVAAYPGADIGSDHNPIIETLVLEES